MTVPAIPPIPNAARPYMPQMDALRAVAIASVLYQHWFPIKIPIGSWGVILFFVISGYLITGSLLALRDDDRHLSEKLARFFTRRFQRLFPAYAVLLVLGCAIFPEIRQHWVWYWGYASNFLALHLGHFVTLGTTWSLAVEEQFYLLWPFVIFLLSLSMIRAVMCCLVVSAVLFRLYMFTHGITLADFLLPANTDALAVGGMLCLLERSRSEIPRWVNWASAAFALACAVASQVWSSLHPIIWTLWPLSAAMLGGCLVWKSRTGFKRGLGKFLEHPAVVYIGRISYGIYLFHMIVPHLPFLWRVGWSANSGSLLRDCAGFFAHCAITISIAAASYHFIERPILSLRLFRSDRTFKRVRLA